MEDPGLYSPSKEGRVQIFCALTCKHLNDDLEDFWTHVESPVSANSKVGLL